jgi:Protein of unknown function (DUF3224)
MSDQTSIRPSGQPHADPSTRFRAKAKITVQNSETEPYDQTASPALVEIRLIETFVGDIEGESPVRALQILRDDKSASQVSVQRFRGKLSGRQGRSCFRAQKSSRTARSRRHGLSFPDQGQANFPGSAARAALKANLDKDQTERWTIGSSDQPALFITAGPQLQSEIRAGRESRVSWDRVRMLHGCPDGERRDSQGHAETS